MARLRSTSPRRILCTHCDRPLDVDAAAKSVNCRHCHQRVVTEALTVKDYVAVRRFNTANAMRITKKGIVYASVRADRLDIEGVLEGAAFALGPIRLRKSARVKADLRGTHLEVDLGATLVGDLRIGPGSVPELDLLAEVDEADVARQSGSETP